MASIAAALGVAHVEGKARYAAYVCKALSTRRRERLKVAYIRKTQKTSAYDNSYRLCPILKSPWVMIGNWPNSELGTESGSAFTFSLGVRSRFFSGRHGYIGNSQIVPKTLPHSSNERRSSMKSTPPAFKICAFIHGGWFRLSWLAFEFLIFKSTISSSNRVFHTSTNVPTSLMASARP